MLVENFLKNDNRGGLDSVGAETATIEVGILSVSFAAGEGIGGRSLSFRGREEEGGKGSNSGKGARFWIGGKMGGVGNSLLLILLLLDV